MLSPTAQPVFLWGGGGGVGCAPLVESLRFQRVDAVDVRDVEEGLVAGWVGGHFHQDLVEEQRLEIKSRK